MLDDELIDDEEESPSPLKINKPTLVVPQIQPKQPSLKNTNSSKQLNSTPMSTRKTVTPAKVQSRKRKSALEKTNGGVEPWNNKVPPGKKQQSLLSFADLQNDSDDDKGTIVKEPEASEIVTSTNDFILNKDMSVQQITGD